jgi:hypothetical protein
VAMTTSVILQFKMKAMINEVTTRPTLCKRIVVRSTTIVCNKIASLCRRPVSIGLVLFKSSNHPISFLRMAVTKQIIEVS